MQLKCIYLLTAIIYFFYPLVIAVNKVLSFLSNAYLEHLIKSGKSVLNIDAVSFKFCVHKFILKLQCVPKRVEDFVLI